MASQFSKLYHYKYFDYLVAAVLFLLALVYYRYTCLNPDNLLAPNTYQARDIRRAIDLYFNHKFIWHGPELSGGGFLPGPFYYFLIGLPYWLTGNLLSIYWLEYILASLGLAIFWVFMKKKYSWPSASVFFVLFLFSPYFKQQLSDFMNPSFVFLFLIVTFICFLQKENWWLVVLGSLAAGLAIQIHYTAAVLIFAFLLSVVVNKDFSTQKKAKFIITLFFCVLLTSGFYLYFVYSENYFSDPNYSFYVAFRRLIVNFAKLLTHVKEVQVNKFIQAIAEDFYVLPSFAFSLFYLNKDKKDRTFLSCMLFCGLALLTKLMLTFGISRYAIPFFFVSLFLFSIYLFQIRKKYIRNLFLALCGVFVIGNLNEHGSNTIFNAEGAWQPMKLGTQIELLQKIKSETNWSFEYFRSHSFFNGLQNWVDFTLTYPKAATGVAVNYDGLFAVRNDLGSFLEGENFSLALAQKVMPENIYRALSQNEISCDKIEEIGLYTICYYRFKNNNEVRNWSNIGYSYDHSYPAYPKSYEQMSGIETNGSNFATIFNNECDSVRPECYVVFNLSLMADSKLKVEVLGAPLAVLDPFNLPRWAWYIEKPMLEVSCHGKISEQLIAGALGMHDARNSFTTPFSELFSLPCAEPETIKLRLDKNITFNILKDPSKGYRFTTFQKTWERNP